MRPPRRLSTLLALGLGLVLLALVAAAWLGAGGPEGLPVSTAPEGPLPPAASAPEPGAGAPPPPEGSEGEDAGAEAPASSEGPLDAIASRAAAWDRVDLDEVREAMPNNLYWKLGVPTEDAALLREREAFRARLNEQYGKVLSNTATEQEVRDYYEQRRRISADYVEFTTHLLDHYGEVIPERDVGLLELARKLHLSRLEELPQKISRALERREEHLEARRAWREQQRRFAGEGGPAPGDAEPSARPR